MAPVCLALYFFDSSITRFLLPSWPKALFLAFLDPSSQQKKNGCPTVMVGAAVCVAGICFFELSLVSY